MSLPFSRAEFFVVFEQYNHAVWPLQIVFLVAAVAMALSAFRAGGVAPRWLLLLLATLWLWMAIVYHAVFFRPINPIAIVFAALFAAQGAIYLFAALRPVRHRLQWHADFAGFAGLALVAYALLIYPALGRLLGHAYPANPTFGLPCPTTLFTIGVLLWTRPLAPRFFAVPLLWSLIGSTAALRLAVYEDAGLLVAAALLCTALIWQRVQRRSTIAPGDPHAA